MLDFVFNDVFRSGYTFTESAVEAHIVYDDALEEQTNALCILAHGLLFEEDIREQEIYEERWHDLSIFFSQIKGDIPFDIFSAIFYLLSRYEEYLPYTEDEFHRFPHQQSLAYRFNFLNYPQVDRWLKKLATTLHAKTGLHLTLQPAKFRPTYDIDIAYSYRGKSFGRQVGGFLRDLLSMQFDKLQERRAVLTGKQEDPYDAYAFLDDLHHQYKVDPIYFFLLSDGGSLDKNCLPETEVMQHLLQQTQKKYTIGIHPSMRSHQQFSDLEKEIARIPHVKKSRQHYIRFQLPETFRNLLKLGIEEDYSMGYGSINGFRASTAHSFLWYDVLLETATSLRLFPFCFMECNTRFEQKQQAQDAYKEMHWYWNQVQEHGGHFISIWHNFSLGNDKDWIGWREAYTQFLEETRK